MSTICEPGGYDNSLAADEINQAMDELTQGPIPQEEEMDFIQEDLYMMDSFMMPEFMGPDPMGPMPGH